ncbi:MAG: DNA polymerase Y family protein [Myxococcota bacterium]|nr:DNA polymerase Y family protein [Myxococcota bacterium]
MNASAPPRTACFLVPDLPRYAEQRAHPELASSIWAVASHSGPRAEILSVSEEAFAAGLRTTLSVAQARSICPELTVRVASPSLQRAARKTLLDLALSVSPRAALAPPGRGLFRNQASVFVDASGVKNLFGSERAFASALAARAEKQTLPGVVVVASSRITSLLIARQMIARSDPQTVCILDPAEESHVLAPLSLDLLDPEPRVAQILTRLGVVCVRDLLRLPRRALTQRVGPEILGLLAQARGEETEPALPVPESNRIEEAIDLEAPIQEMEPLSFVLRGLISRLIERLELRGLSCSSLELTLRIEGGGHDARRIGLAGPTLDLRVLLRVTLLGITDRPPRAAIESVTLSSEGVAGRSDQLDLFLPRGPDPAALGRTLAELESLCGEGRVGTPQIARDHHPSEFELQPFSPPRARPQKHSSPKNAPASYEAELSLPALRALRPPMRAEVQVGRGGPRFIRCALTQGEVIQASGPWRTTGRWWSESERFAFDHFDIEMQDGLVARLCFDWVARVWQIDGIYD